MMTTDRTTRGRERELQAGAYVWGREDAGDRRLRDAMVGSSTRIADCEFARFAADQADAFEREQRVWLAPISEQYAAFVAAHTPGCRFRSDATGDVWEVTNYLAIANEVDAKLVDGPHGVPSSLPLGPVVTWSPGSLAQYRLVTS